MWDTLVNSFALFAQVDNALALLVGVIVGTVIGAIPGMTTPMGVALALPFTFTMQPVTGILLLLGVYKGGLYGGSITRINESLVKGRNGQMPAFGEFLGEAKVHLLTAYVYALSQAE